MSFTFATDNAIPVHPVSALDYIPLEKLREIQLHRLQNIVRYAYERQRLFRRRCDELGVRPEHIKTLKDIRLLPFSKKVDLRDEYPTGLQAAPNEEVVRYQCSSGTTGKPIVIPNTMNDIKVWQQGVMRCLAMGGVSANDIVQVAYGYGLFTGGLGLHYGAEGIGCAVLPISGGNTDRQIMLMRDLGVTTLSHMTFTDSRRLRVPASAAIASIARACTFSKITSIRRSSIPKRSSRCPTANMANWSLRRSTVRDAR